MSNGCSDGYSFDKFAEQHKMQLVMSGIPSHFWPKLHEKLANEVNYNYTHAT